MQQNHALYPRLIGDTVHLSQNLDDRLQLASGSHPPYPPTEATCFKMDLSYRESQLEHPDILIGENSNKVLRLFRKHKPEVVIFGLINKSAHLGVWREFREK